MRALPFLNPWMQPVSPRRFGPRRIKQARLLSSPATRGARNWGYESGRSKGPQGVQVLLKRRCGRLRRVGEGEGSIHYVVVWSTPWARASACPVLRADCGGFVTDG